MKKKTRPSRRDFMKGTLAAGAALAFAKYARGAQNDNPVSGYETPLATERIPQPDNNMCSWVGFSPLNDQTAFVSGIIMQTSLYVSRAGQPESFDVLWGTNANINTVGPCAWSPNGREIAFLAQSADKKSAPGSARNSICIADVVSRAVREPVIISEIVNQEKKQYVNVSYQKGLSWWNESNVCVPVNGTGGVLKFDTHSGQSEAIIPPQSDAGIFTIALTASGELRFIKAKGIEAGSSRQYLLCGMMQDGIIHEYANLTEQFGEIIDARLSEGGEFVFIEKYDAPPQSMPLFKPMTDIIYKIESRSVVGQIPHMVSCKGDMYVYLPMTVRNNNELILIEGAALATGGAGFEKNMTTRVVKKMI